MADNTSLMMVRMNRQHRYEAVGRCIYCPNPSDSDEHIVPRNLGGMLTLPDASCADCRDITGALEGKVADSIYRPARRQLGFPRRHKKVPQPPMTAEVDGVETILEDKDFPGILVAFKFPAPSILKLGPPATEMIAAGIDARILPEFGDRLNRIRGGANQVRFSTKSMDTVLFCRLLAKIAHCYAVAELGVDGFKPYLLDIIRDPDARFIGEYVGDAMAVDNRGEDLHEVYQEDFYRKSKHVVVCVRLFGNYGLPTYWVVAGERL